MPLSVPTVRGGAAALTPLRRRVSYATDIFQAGTAAEQRCPTRGPLNEFTLQYNGINKTDKNSLVSFMASAKGMQSNQVQLVLGSVTYSNLALMSDGFTSVENPTTLYTASLALRQTIPQTITTAAYSTTFPTISSGLSQLPFNQELHSKTTVNEMPTGERVAYGYFGTGLTGFPTTTLRTWAVSYPILSDADLVTLENHFHGCQGAFGQWTRVDPDDSTSHTKCRYGDTLDIVYTIPNVNAVTFTVTEYF